MHAFKGKMRSPHPPPSIKSRGKVCLKVKAWGKAFQIMWDMKVSSLRLWTLVSSGARIVTIG
jgi:hypothetical protein